MEFHSNLDAANWIQPDKQLFRLNGWVLAKGSTPLQAIRLRNAHHCVNGYFGIHRPDVARVHGRLPQAAYCGFSLLSTMKERAFPSILEVQDATLGWHKLDTIDAARITSTQVSPLPVAAELEALQPNLVTAPPDGKSPVLFISHDFAAAGAQMILLRLLRWLRAHSDIRFEVLIAVPRGAAAHASAAEQQLLAGFNEAGPVHFLSDLTSAPENLSRIQRGCYRLIYANTATLGWLLPTLGSHICPVATHVHEMGFWIEKRTGLKIFARQAAHTDRFIACSTAVRDYLTGRPKIPADKIEVIHDSCSTVQAQRVRLQHSREAIRRELGIPPGAFVVAACGTFDWRKGADLFTPICVALRRKLGERDFRAWWIGDYGTDLVRDQFAHDAEIAGLTGKISLVGYQREPLRWMFAADCFALTSREDPFPVVMLEAGALGLPVVGFEHSGGITEFVDEHAGLVVPYLDVEAFADALCRLAESPALASSLGQAAQARAIGIYDEHVSFQRTMALIETLSNAAVQNLVSIER